MNTEFEDQDLCSIYLGPTKWTNLFCAFLEVEVDEYLLINLPKGDLTSKLLESLDQAQTRWKFNVELKGGVTILRFHSAPDRTLFQLAWGNYL